MRPTLRKNPALEDEEMVRRNTAVLRRIAEAHGAGQAPSPDSDPFFGGLPPGDDDWPLAANGLSADEGTLAEGSPPADEAPPAPEGEPAWKDPEPNLLAMFGIGVLLALALTIALNIIERDMPPRHTPVTGPAVESVAHEALGARIAVARVQREAERRAHPGRFMVVRPGWRWAAGKDGYDKVLGTVYNGSLRTATAWRATVFYYDVAGRVLGAHSTFSSTPLLPGGTQQFLMFHRHVPNAATAEAMVVQANFRE